MSHGRPKVLLAAAFAALPAILFYGILFHKAINIPFEDDYEALLDFLNQMAVLRNGSERAAYFFAAMFNEYKLFFGHAVAWCQLALCGHSDITVLCALGNGFALLLAILFWKMLLPDDKDLAYRIAVFIPVSCLLFQLGYAETLDWAMPSLQNLPVLVFSLGTIYLLVQSSLRTFLGSLIGLVLAISASGNGLLVIPIGVFILSAGRHFNRLANWLFVSAGCVAAYTYRYHVIPSQSQHSILAKMILAATTLCVRLYR